MKNLTEKNFKLLIRVSAGILIGILAIALANISLLALPIAGVALVFAIGDKYFSKEITWLEVTMKEKAKISFADEEAGEEEEAPKPETKKVRKKVKKDDDE